MAVFNQNLTLKQLMVLLLLWAADDTKDEAGITEFFTGLQASDYAALQAEGYISQDAQGGWFITASGQTDIDDLFAQSEGDNYSVKASDAINCSNPDANALAPYDQLLIDLHNLWDTAPTFDACVTQPDIDCMKLKTTWAINRLKRGHKAMSQASAVGFRNQAFNRTRNNLLDARGIDVHFSCMSGSNRNTNLRDPMRTLMNTARDSIALSQAHLTDLCVASSSTANISLRQYAILIYAFVHDDALIELADYEARFNGVAVVDDLTALQGYGYMGVQGTQWYTTTTDILTLFASDNADGFEMTLSESSSCYGIDNLPPPFDQLATDVLATLDTAPSLDACVTQADLDCAKAKAADLIINLSNMYEHLRAVDNSNYNTNFWNRSRDVLDDNIVDVDLACMSGTNRSTLVSSIDGFFNTLRDNQTFDPTIYDNIC